MNLLFCLLWLVLVLVLMLVQFLVHYCLVSSPDDVDIQFLVSPDDVAEEFLARLLLDYPYYGCSYSLVFSVLTNLATQRS